MQRLERMDLAIYTRQIARQSTWCGVVFALAILLTVLNVLPPVPMHYRVEAKLMVEPARVEALMRNLKQATNLASPAWLQDFRVLDRTGLKEQPTKILDGTDRIYLTIRSIWHQRCDSDQFRSWVESITQLPSSQSRETQLVAAQRMARWELTAAEHYRAQHNYLSHSPSELAEQLEAKQLAFDTTQPALSDTMSDAAPARVTAVGTGRLASAPLRTGHDYLDASRERDHLAQEVDRAKQGVVRSQAEVDLWMQRFLGQLQITDKPRITPIAGRIPVWIAASVIIVGLAAGASAGWFQWRLQSGGVHDPADVATHLASRGYSPLARIELPSDLIDSTDWMEIAGRRASEAGRRTARNLIWLSELTLAAWCLLIAGRIALDPIWRSLAFDNPLAAFGRLVTGLH
ncbi:MAG: hypothetical protein KF752_12530 [Pirellulaceae bacterium]|nr:hypothetical protein [Pirellulaceae bacterium]